MFFELVPCQNLRVREAIKGSRRYNNTSDLPPVGKGLCYWCGKEVIKPRRKYCSLECKESANMMLAPQSDSGRGFLFNRQGWKCNHCGLSWEKYKEFFLKCFPEKEHIYFRLGRFLNGCLWIKDKGFIHPIKEGMPRVENHHIIPVSEGGDCYGFDNLEALCGKCHLLKHSKQKG